MTAAIATQPETTPAPTASVICCDCSALPLPNKSVDLVFGSPPYEAARTYGIGFNLRGQAWVDWAVTRFVEHLRVSRGLVAWVIAGQTRNYQWSATPAMFMADLHRRGVCLRNPPIFHRVGIPGSGGPDWLRADYEWIVCATAERGRLPWSDNRAMGHPPRWAPGGAMSNRLSSGARVNQRGHSIDSGATTVDAGGVVRSEGKRPSHQLTRAENIEAGGIVHTKRVSADKWGGNDVMESQVYLPPAIANPGNVIKRVVGGGVMGSRIAHENEAPFPESLAEFFVRSFCPPGGTVLDPFSGSGTTAAVALKNGRNAIATDIRESQCELTRRRIAEVAARES